MTESFFSMIQFPGKSFGDYIKPESSFTGGRDSEDKRLFYRRFGISEKDVLVILHAGTSQNFSLRRWPAEYFIRLADLLIEHLGVKIYFTGEQAEKNLVVRIMNGIPHKKDISNLCGKMSFLEFSDLIKRSDLVVSADTSSIHIASYFSVPVAGLYGPNTPALYGPWGEKSIFFYEKLPCSPCITNYNAKINKCAHPEGAGTCMKRLRAEDVFHGIKKHYFDQVDFS